MAGRSQLAKGLGLKVATFVQSVTRDPRWDLNDELMVQVLGFTLYGYAFGAGRSIFFLDVADIQKAVTDELVKLGLGRPYAGGMIESAQEIFESQETESIHAQLIGAGHSHFAADDLTELRESIFENTQSLQEQME